MGNLGYRLPTVTLPLEMHRKEFRAIDIFHEFISKGQLAKFADYTNEHANARWAGNGSRTWADVTLSDMYLFLAFLIYSGCVRLQQMGNYFDRSGSWGKHRVADFMTRK